VRIVGDGIDIFRRYGMPLNRMIARVLRLPGARSLWLRWPVGSVETRIAFDIWPRPHYAFGVYSAARLAKSLGLPGISVAEFGVAGGRGLLALERVSCEIARALGLRIDVFGFDSGIGMPEAADYRDLPHVWCKGFYAMDVRALTARLSSAKLILGDVARTVPEWAASQQLLPIGFVAFDLDYYSSTSQALRIFDGDQRTRLPRVICYLDDIMWPEYAYHNEFVGELLAIREFNKNHNDRKLCPIHLLRNMRMIPRPWNDQMYVMHDFVHHLYCVNLTHGDSSYTQLPIQ